MWKEGERPRREERGARPKGTIRRVMCDCYWAIVMGVWREEGRMSAYLSLEVVGQREKF